MQLSRRIACGLISIMAATLVLPIPPRAADDAAPKDLRVALQGFDPVAYFTDGRPRKGSPELWAVFDGTVYQFATPDHRALFMEDPDRYAPQYAGFCTGAIALGMVKVEADPQAWVITEGRLFVFFANADVTDFAKTRLETIRAADANWRQMQAGQ
jgi:hypothetical protein